MPAAEPVDAAAAIETDALVIGAGPVGLFQVFQLGLQGIAAQVVDALPQAGGQCIALYPDKPIYDIPALPVCTGRELIDRLLLQVAPFAPRFHFGQTVTALQPRPDGRFDLATSAGSRFSARSVFIAGGVGAFQPRELQVDGAARHLGRQLLHHVPDAAQLAGRQILVLGGDDAAVQAAADLAELGAGPADASAGTADRGAQAAPRPASVTLLHRRSSLNAEPGLLARLEALRAAGALRFEVGQILALEDDGAAEPRLTGVQLVDADGQQRRLPVDSLLVFLGLSPKLGPIADWGLAMARRQLLVDTARFETALPGLYAVGDVVSYPGKKKLILCGFHEATLAAFAGAARLHPDEPVLLQYTTTSSTLHRRLGVAGPVKPG